MMANSLAKEVQGGRRAAFGSQQKVDGVPAVSTRDTATSTAFDFDPGFHPSFAIDASPDVYAG